MRWLMGGQVYDVEQESFLSGGRCDRGRPHRRARQRRQRRAAGDETVDVVGLWLLPGLIDCHVHLTQPTDAWRSASGFGAHRRRRSRCSRRGPPSARCWRGITTVRDVGGWNYVEMAVRDAIRRAPSAGRACSSPVELLSITTSTADYYPGMYEVADGADAVRAAARRQLAHGADLIKVMATGAMLSSETEDSRAIQFTLDELTAAVEIAHDNHKHVAAHCHALRGIHNAVEAGVDSIEHCTFADDDALRKMAAAGTALVPTMCAGEMLFRDPAAVASMPEYLRSRMAEFNDVHLATIQRAHELGVTIAMGTDAGTPGNHHGLNVQECVILAEQVGMTPAQSIRSATLNAAALLRRPITWAALMRASTPIWSAFAANPLDDIEELARPTMVVKAGDVVRDDRT